MMNCDLTQHIIENSYNKAGCKISEFITEKEGKEYNACRFKINNHNVICRNGKITPKKIGQFVTFWKRNNQNITAPFTENDDFRYYVINVKQSSRIGQFVFPKSALIKNGIVTTTNKDGKRGFRIYPIWDIPKNKQALKTQQWQLDFFYEINDFLDLKKVSALYS